ncbi:MAG: D-aminoacyl-tRNA deacylase [Patescibacteria group bacterium]
MKIVIQRVFQAKVTVAEKTIGKVGAGYVVLIGVKKEDRQEQADILVQKLLNLRIMADEADKMNKSIIDTKGEILAISQFTLYGDTRKGNRPSFIESAPPEEANQLIKYFIEELKKSGLKVEQGEFGAMMKVELVNDGPVTIILET